MDRVRVLTCRRALRRPPRRWDVLRCHTHTTLLARGRKHLGSTTRAHSPEAAAAAMTAIATGCGLPVRGQIHARMPTQSERKMRWCLLASRRRLQCLHGEAAGCRDRGAPFGRCALQSSLVLHMPALHDVLPVLTRRRAVSVLGRGRGAANLLALATPPLLLLLCPPSCAPPRTCTATWCPCGSPRWPTP